MKSPKAVEKKGGVYTHWAIERYKTSRALIWFYLALIGANMYGWYAIHTLGGLNLMWLSLLLAAVCFKQELKTFKEIKQHEEVKEWIMRRSQKKS